jgi:GNAT superfamily N-acetyltransferase
MEPLSAEVVTRRVRGSDRNVLAELLLDAYRDTIDDEGEDIDDALAAVDHYFSASEHEHSFVVPDGDRVVAMAFVVVVDGVHYVDPIVVAADRKRTGLGRDAVRVLLNALAAAGVTEVGATITDGNTASERLFLGLGFVRRGPWAWPISGVARTFRSRSLPRDHAGPASRLPARPCRPCAARKRDPNGSVPRFGDLATERS